MSRLLDHIHISERESDGSWEDCTFDSGLEWYRLCVDPRKPATHAEAEALRRASGRAMTGGSNLSDFRKGVLVRYGKTLPALVSNRTILKPGQAAVRQGSMKAFGPGHRLSKWQTNFDGGHAVLEYKDLDGNLFWCDPLAPTNAAVPVRVTQDEVDAYAKAYAGSYAIVGTIKNITAQEALMPAIVKYLPGYTANIKPSSNVRSAPLINSSTLLRKTGTSKEAVVVTGTVKGDVDPANGSTEWYTWWKNGRWEYTAKDNVLDLKAPAAISDGIDQSDVDAAKAAGYASGKTDGVALGETQGVAKEQARIKQVLGLP